MDVEKILSTNIPDIYPVYGGVRGRTMSSKHQIYAWPVLKEAGLQTIIDLRDQDFTDKYQKTCEKRGFRYFHYPVDNKGKTVPSMVQLLPQFCELIDQGNFYIACALGLHRTDVALCTYWMFYGADKGLPPPAIRGYRQEDGHDTSKIMRVLNSIYKYMTEERGEKPIPETVFNDRKKIINELSQQKNDSA